MQVSSCLPIHLLSGKEGPSCRIWGAFLFPNGVFLMHISFVLCVFPFVNMVMDSIVPSRLWWHVFLSQVVKLYERCVIACANYTEYWIRYVLCMEATGNMDLANNALARATQVFVKVWSFWDLFFHFVLSVVSSSIECHGKLLVITTRSWFCFYVSCTNLNVEPCYLSNTLIKTSLHGCMLAVLFALSLT